ncbi:MAG: YgiQ family radical SAM protein [Thermovirgaceae bacterium]
MTADSQIESSSRDGFLPVNLRDMKRRGWDELDFLFVTGDAYVDHPSFAHAVISRVLESAGYRVGIVAQPDWRDAKNLAVMGKPRLAVLVSAGNLDSMLSNYTAAKKPRRSDRYSPGGIGGKRPDRATIVYCNLARSLWKDTPLVIGGIEASLRRFAHYDYWSDSIRRPVLADSRADLLVWGMGETPILEIARRLERGEKATEITGIRGTCLMTKNLETFPGIVEIPSFEEVAFDKKAFAEAFRMSDAEQDPGRGRPVAQRVGTRWMIQNAPAKPMTPKGLDAVYELPYTRKWHPSCNAEGGVPALDEVKFSITAHRGCFGGCAFCALSSHQGRIIQPRSRASILREARLLTEMEDFKGYIHDIGGPTANFNAPACALQEKGTSCDERLCLWPTPCPNLKTGQGEYLDILRAVRALPGVKKVFVRSGIRYDYLADDNSAFLEEICAHHVSGQLKVAPEHVAKAVTDRMRKSGKETFLAFKKKFEAANKKVGKKQFLVPYLMSSHPGSTLKDAVELAEFLRDIRYQPRQVQDFIPTPGTLSTCMYWTGLDPFTAEPVYVPKSYREKSMQRALLQYRNPKNRKLVEQALHEAGREDLIGKGPKCLILPAPVNRKGLRQGKGKHPGAKKMPPPGQKN